MRWQTTKEDNHLLNIYKQSPGNWNLEKKSSLSKVIMTEQNSNPVLSGSRTSFHPTEDCCKEKAVRIWMQLCSWRILLISFFLLPYLSVFLHPSQEHMFPAGWNKASWRQKLRLPSVPPFRELARMTEIQGAPVSNLYPGAFVVSSFKDSFVTTCQTEGQGDFKMKFEKTNTRRDMAHHFGSS